MGEAPAADPRPPEGDYALLKRLVTERGLLERHPARYLGRSAALSALLAVIVAGLIATRGSLWALAWAVPAALLFGQLGFFAHEAAHNQVMRTSRGNYVLSLLLFNLSLGGSRGWWADKHNVHHAEPNRVGTDPDIAPGVVAMTRDEAIRSHGVERAIMRRQAGAIWPLLCLGVLQVHALSAGFLFSPRLRNAGREAALLAGHAAAYLAGLVLVLGVVRGLLFALLHRLLLGGYLGAAFLPNHVGMPMLEQGQPLDFMGRQVLTSRNLRGGAVTDFVFGGLACQIEHHLFPTMPRRNLRLAAPIVRHFCAERGMAYHETSVLAGFGEVRRHLAWVAAPLRAAAPAGG